MMKLSAGVAGLLVGGVTALALVSLGIELGERRVERRIGDPQGCEFRTLEWRGTEYVTTYECRTLRARNP